MVNRPIMLIGGQGYVGMNLQVYNAALRGVRVKDRSSMVSLDMSDQNTHFLADNFTYSPLYKHKDLYRYQQVDYFNTEEVRKAILKFKPRAIILLSDISSINGAEYNTDLVTSKHYVEATKNFVQMLDELPVSAGVDTLIYSSSYAIYGEDSLSPIVYTESYPYKSHEDHLKFNGAKLLKYGEMKVKEELELLSASSRINVCAVRLPNIVGIYNPYNVWKRLHTPTSYAFRILFKLCHSALVKAVYGQREEVVLYQRKTVSRYSASSYPIRNFVNIYNICRLLFGLVKYYENKQGCRDLFNYTEDNQYLSVFDLHNAVRNIVGTPASVFKDSKPKRECLFMGCDSSKIKELGFDYQSISMERSILETCVDIMAKHMNLIKGISESGFNKYISVYGDEEWN